MSSRRRRPGPPNGGQRASSGVQECSSIIDGWPLRHLHTTAQSLRGLQGRARDPSGSERAHQEAQSGADLGPRRQLERLSLRPWTASACPLAQIE